MRQMLYRIGVLPLTGALVGSPEVASVFEAAGQLSDLGFSRAQEEDADRVGYEILRRARLPTEGMAAFFDTLENKGGASPPALLSTHPGSAERAAALRRRAATDGILVTEPLPIDWTSVVMAGKGAGGKGASAPDAPPPAKP
jgi:predicted Zn-dependent protease